MITADRGFIQFLGPDFGFWLLGRSDRIVVIVNLHIPEEISLSLFMCAMLRSGENDVDYINISLIVILNAKTISQKATPANEVALYLAHHLTRQRIGGFGFS